MAEHSQFGLLKERRFAPFFATQSLGAFNDNVFKQALIALVTQYTVGIAVAERTNLTNLAAGLFILPFFLFSATSGQLSDKYDKAVLARIVKALEVLIMVTAAIGFITHTLWLLFAMLFLMGLHSTIFGPLKYGVVPQVLETHEIVGGNALIEMATMVAILVGSNLGAILIGIPGNGAWIVAAVTIAIALIGLATAFAMPSIPSVAPNLKINWNPFTETWRNLKQVRGNRTVFLSVLGISWFWFYGSMYFTQLPVFARDVVGGNPTVYPFLLSIFTIGVALGSLLCERLSGHKVEIGLVPFGSIGMTAFGVDLYFAMPEPVAARELTIMMLLQAPGGVRLCIDLLLMAVFAGFFIVPLFALVQTRSDRDRVSRVIAANNILNAMFMVAAVAIAIIMLNFAHFSIPQLLLFTALLNAVVAIYIYTLVPEFLMRFLTWILINTLYRVRVEGLDKIPDEGPALIVANHVSFMDPLLIGGTVRRPVRFVMYHKIFKIPVMNWIFRTARAIPIASRKEDEAMMERAFAEVDRELAEGNIVAIFPEGGITRSGDIETFRPGVDRILATRPVPVIPIALRGLWGSLFSRRDSLPGRMRLPRRFWSRIALVVGDPVPPEEASAAELEKRVRALRGDWA
jgi:1-acyl-sn-glycerol-3-phosphate acyltransferase